MMRKFDVVCVDMFQTLVDIETRKKFIWKRILKESYSDELADKYGRSVISKVSKKIYNYNGDQSEKFQNLRSIFEVNFSEVFSEEGLEFCPTEASEIFMQEHHLSHLYEETDLFLRLVREKYPICLISDADNQMVLPLIEKFKFDKVLISEDIEVYKSHPSGKIFKEAINHYRVRPERIIHIGDSSADVIGADKAGITSCWLNRHNIKWNYDIKPKHTISSLTEILPLLGIDRTDLSA